MNEMYHNQHEYMYIKSIELFFRYYGRSRISVCNGQFEINKEITT